MQSMDEGGMFTAAMVWAKERLGPALGGCFVPLVEPLERDVVAQGAALHREVVVPLAAWAGFSEGEQRRIGMLFDVLQVVIDVTDNLADREEDAREGRVWPYGGVPEGVLYALPPLLLGHVVREVAVGFAGYDGGYASSRLLGVLNGMVSGQGEESGSDEKVALVAGEQAVLLCLPLWLARGRLDVMGVVGETEAWARAWGMTWELRALMREGRLEDGRRLLMAQHRAKQLWPEYGPFIDGTLNLSLDGGMS